MKEQRLQIKLKENESNEWIFNKKKEIVNAYDKVVERQKKRRRKKLLFDKIKNDGKTVNLKTIVN